MNIDSFELEANEELFWVYSASSLWTAANILLEKEKQRKHVSGIREPHLLRVSIMLVGFAIENLIKGVIAKEEGILKKTQEIQEIKEPHHDLLRLFKKISFSLSPDEEKVVSVVKEYVMWAGRYPIPKKADQKPQSGLLSRAGRNRKKSSEGDWMIDELSEFRIEPDIFNVSQGLLRKLKQRIIPGKGFNFFG